MIHIILACAAGMSTSMLVTQMQRAAKTQEEEVRIRAISTSEIDHVVATEKVDLILLGPQVKYQEKTIKERVQSQGVPVAVIAMSDYGRMDGKAVLKAALQMIKG